MSTDHPSNRDVDPMQTSKFVSIAAACLCGGLLSGCAAVDKLEAYQQARYQKQQAENQARCERYGFTNGTDAFAQCLMEQDRLADESARRAMEGARQARERSSRNTQPQTIVCRQQGPGTVRCEGN